MRLVWPLLALFLAGCASDVPHPYPALPPPEPTLAGALLWSDPFPALLVEIDHVDGRAPSALALQTFRETLAAVTRKSEIAIQPPTRLPADDNLFHGYREWTLEELAEVHARYFDARAPGGYGDAGVARLHVLYLNGYYPLNSTFHGLPEQANGLKFADALYIFLDDPGQDPQSRPWMPYFERKTLIHELGHALGLVNMSIPMQRPHVAADGIHSNNDRSVMSQGHRGPFALEMVQDGEWIPYRFDADDLADVRAFQAGEPAGP